MPLQQPDILPISEEDYILDENYAYEWDINGIPQRINIPKGFIYDGASVPRLLWSVSGLTPDGLIRAAALVHDWIYNFEGMLPEGSYQYFQDGQWKQVHGKWKRKDADRLFARMMKEANVPKWKRQLAYQAVRWFGRAYWNE